ncbi:MAG: sodium:solute symporter family protein [Candidatus Krumholzibacteriia bacterium]
MIAAAVYALFLIYAVARLFRRPAGDAADYIVAGRRLSLPGFTASLVATWYGGILGVGEYGWTYGLASWFVFGLPYYLAAGLFAFFMAGRARRSRALTIPDQLERAHGRPAALAAAAVLAVMTAPAAYVLMLGVLVQLATGYPLWVGVTVGTALSVSYVFRGGLRAIVGTDMVQLALMFLAFLVLVPACVARWGGWSFLAASLPAGHLQPAGGQPWQALAVWYFIALQTLVEPTFYQRCYAARDERTARRGILLAIGFWLVFDALTTAAGLYARAVLPDLDQPVAAFPALAAATLAPFWQGVFLVGLLATIMSTVDSYAFVCAITLGRDLMGRWRAPAGVPREEAEPPLAWIRAGLVVTAALAVVLALTARSVVGLWYHLGSVATPVLLVPLALAQAGRERPPRRTAWLMAVTGAVTAGWLLAGRGAPFLGVEAIFPGLLVSALHLPPGRSRPRARGG